MNKEREEQNDLHEKERMKRCERERLEMYDRGRTRSECENKESEQEKCRL